MMLTMAPSNSASSENASWLASLDAEAVAAARITVASDFLIVVKFKIIVSVD